LTSAFGCINVLTMNLYGHHQVIDIFPDLKARTLISWSEKGLFTPEVNASGTGSRRLYSAKNLVEIGVIRELVSYRIPHDFIRSVMERLRKTRLSEKDGFDVVITLSRQLLGGGKDDIGFLLDVRVGKRSNFRKEAGELVFGERWPSKQTFQRTPSTASAVVVSLADIWEFVRDRV